MTCLIAYSTFFKPKETTAASKYPEMCAYISAQHDCFNGGDCPDQNLKAGQAYCTFNTWSSLEGCGSQRTYKYDSKSTCTTIKTCGRKEQVECIKKNEEEEKVRGDNFLGSLGGGLTSLYKYDSDGQWLSNENDSRNV